jgi:UDP-N-acetylmuramyl pentapeptide synthase
MCYTYDHKIRRHHILVPFAEKRFEFILPHSMSLGTVKNFFLACVCAMKCGVTAEEIQSSILRWTPPKWRGEIITRPQRTYFVDCYNANLVSFLDSLPHFDRLFPGGGRLFVVGELKSSGAGETTAKENEIVLKSLPIRKGDIVVVIGENAEKLANEVPCEYSQGFSTTNEAINCINDFSGTVYLKGHRCYGLENLII